MFVLVSTEWVMMCPAVDDPASCEIGAVNHFLHTKNMSAAVYGQNVMSEGTVRQ
jgi:hypothetical protein